MEHPPHPALARHVECYWTSAASPGERRILPDGCMDVIFAGHAESAWRGEVVGTMSRALVLPGGGTERYVGVRFRPGRAPAFLKVPARALLDDAAETGAVGLGRLDGEIARAASVAEKIAALEAWLLTRLAEGVRTDPYVDAVVERIVGPGGSVEELSEFAGISRQHLARRFAEHVGVGPKAFARIVRFRAVVVATRAAGGARERARGAGAVDWAALACELGYSDQSHLIAEFKEFSGFTPTAWPG